MTAWIKMISDDDASNALKAALEVVRAPSGDVGNVMRVHSLRPESMIGHHMIYMAALHSADNRLPDWLLEVLASYVSILNGCEYSLTNHFANARHLIADETRADEILTALKEGSLEGAFEGSALASLRYAAKLTQTPGEIEEADISALRDAGFDDGEILEINQVCCYFNYVNRVLNGLGVTLQGDIIGYYAGAGSVDQEGEV